MIVIPNVEKPDTCWECFNVNCNHWGENGYDNSDVCPLIEIDESEMEYLYKTFGLEEDENLTDRAQELKRAILMGYLYAKKDVVRCKECIHRIDDSDFQSGHVCLLRRSNGGLYCEDNDSCSYGERKTDEKHR